MTSTIFTDILKSLSFLSLLLLLGLLLRSKLKILQYLFLPSSVIGGFIGLIIVQTKIIAIPTEWVITYSLLPGILIIPIFASIPLGMNISNKNNAIFLTSNIIKSFAIFMAASMAQSTIGYATNIIFTHIKPEINLYRTFGYELSAGFSGGHGMAAATGKMLEGFNVSYWEIAQGISMTTATVGLVGGMIFGIIFINIAIRKQETNILKKPSEMHLEIKNGFCKDIEKQHSIGRETFTSNSIETITFHLSIIFIVCGVAYILLELIKKTDIAGLKFLPVWTYSMLIMFIVNIIIKKAKFDWAIDYKLKSKIMNVFSDFAIVSAITSLPLKTVLEYIEPVAFMMIIGFIITYIIIFKISKLVFKDYIFERAIISWGAATGVLITGMTLLKICDSEYKTPALRDFSLGFSLMGISSLFVTPILNSILATGTTMLNFVVSLIFALIYILLALVFLLKKN